MRTVENPTLGENRKFDDVIYAEDVVGFRQASKKLTSTADATFVFARHHKTMTAIACHD